jgi:hypothetical protein
MTANMKKTILLTLLFALFFSGCFSFSSLNPFSSSEEEKENSTVKHAIEIPSNAPVWLKKKTARNKMVAIGISKNVEEKNFNFFKKKALVVASNNLSRKIYAKAVNLYKNYEKRLQNDLKIYDKDIKKVSEDVALKALNKALIEHQWIDKKTLYVQISVDSQFVAQLVQNNSKQLFKLNKDLYSNFLSNRALRDITLDLESVEN